MSLTKQDIDQLASGDSYLSFMPLTHKSSDLVWNPIFDDVCFVDTTRKVDEGYCYQEKFRFQGTPKPFNLQAETWLSVLFLFQFLIYSYVFIRFHKFWSESFKELFQVKERSSLFMDSSLRDSRQNLYLSFFTAINLGVFLYLFITNGKIYFESKNVTVLLFILISGVFFLLKFMFLDFLGFVFFGRDSVVDVFKNNILTLFSFLGMVILPILLLLIYSSCCLPGLLFFAGVIVYSFFVLLTIYKMMKIFYVELYSFLYLILYLCTLEILPVILLYVALVNVEQIV